MLRIESFYNLLISLHFYIYFKIRKNCAGVHILYMIDPTGPCLPPTPQYIYLFIHAANDY